MENPKIYLVRSPSSLIGEGQAGYGWPQVDFSQASSTKELFDLFSEKGIRIGRKRNQIKRFFSIFKGDIVVVPLQRSVAFGFATGVRYFSKGIGYGENRIGVEYLRNEDGSVIRVPRSHLPEALSTRLRIRMAVVSLDEFNDDILRIVRQIEKTGGSRFNSHVQTLEANALEILQKKLLVNIQKGKTFLKSGGDGLENLVAELLSIEGYATKIFSKSAHKELADADVEAIREDRFSSTKILIQVKHHVGITGFHALRQLQELDSDENAQCWLITTGKVSPEMIEEAESQEIGVMDGENFAEWVVDKAHKLSPITLNKLGLSTLPSLLL